MYVLLIENKLSYSDLFLILYKKCKFTIYEDLLYPSHANATLQKMAHQYEI